MRVNIYAEEMTDRVEKITKKIEGIEYTGIRLYLYLPVTHDGVEFKGPFIHHKDDDDSSAITFWGKRNLRKALVKMIEVLDNSKEEVRDSETSDDGA